jgi:hypothetical protein
VQRLAYKGCLGLLRICRISSHDWNGRALFSVLVLTIVILSVTAFQYLFVAIHVPNHISTVRIIMAAAAIVRRYHSGTAQPDGTREKPYPQRVLNDNYHTGYSATYPSGVRTAAGSRGRLIRSSGR